MPIEEEVKNNSDSSKPTRAKTTKTKTAKSDNESVKKRIIPKDVDLGQLIEVRNGYQGQLIYKSARTGETFVWPEFGAEQSIELRELRNAKNTYKKFFQNNWFMFDDEYAWVIDYLGVTPYYANALKLTEFDELFSMPADEIGEKLSKLSKGQRKSIGYRARQLVTDGTIDSIKAIKAIENSLGIELIEK